MSLVVKSVVSKVAKKYKKRVASSLYDALDKKVQELLSKAAERAQANGRQTIMAQDL